MQTSQNKKRGRGKNYSPFQSGDRWGVDYRTPEGRRVRKLIGTYEDAKSERTKIETTKKAGLYVDESKSPTFEDFSKEYLANVSAQKASHATEKRLMGNLVAYFDQTKLSKITRQKVRDYHSLRAKDVSGVPLDSIARHELAEHKTRAKNEELVFPSFDNNGNIVPLSDVKTAFKQALQDAGIADFRFRDSRHAFASHYVMRGGNLYTLGKILGQRDIKMTQRYAKLSPDFIQGEKERLDSIWTIGPKTTQEHPAQVASNLIQ